MGALIGGWFAAHGVELALALIGLIFTKQKAGESRKEWLRNVGKGAFYALEDIASRDLKMRGEGKKAEALALVKKRILDGAKKPLTADEEKFLDELFWGLANEAKTKLKK